MRDKENLRKWRKQYYRKISEKRKLWHLHWRKKNPDKVRESNKRYRITHIKYVKEWHHKNYIKKRNEILIHQKGYYMRNRENRAKYAKIWYNRNRMTILTHYGGIPPKCACCKETEIKFLCVDHIFGKGNKHRKQLAGRTIYRWLIKNNFPDGFQILCYNCNCAKAFYGHCPHESVLDIWHSKIKEKRANNHAINIIVNDKGEPQQVYAEDPSTQY